MAKDKKYGLVFENKKEDCEDFLKDHHIFLSEDKNLSIKSRIDRHHNLLIEGENLHALKILAYTHTGKVDTIYIDSPYNTGNEDFVYNDKFVDKEDGWRHSKWLSFMEKRLRMARQLLSDRGVIFFSIDDNEFAQLKLLCDQIFGENNFIANMIWKKKHSGAHDSRFVDTTHEYVLVYVKDIKYWLSKDHKFNQLSANVEDDDSYKFSDEYVAERGKYKLQPLDAANKGERANLMYGIPCPDGSLLYPKPGSRWVWEESRVQKAIRTGFLEFKQRNNEWTVKYKQYQFVDKDGNKKERTNPIQSILNDESFNPTTARSASELKEIFNGSVPFNYAKPVELIKRLLFISTQKDSIVLDFFAGTGTTGQAVAELNGEDGGNRQFILVTNNENNICKNITYVRLQKTIGKENLKYLKVDSLKFKSEARARIMEQLQRGNVLEATLCVKYSCFDVIEESKHYNVFKNEKGEMLVNFYNDMNKTKIKALDRSHSKLEGNLKNGGQKNVFIEKNDLLRGYADEYLKFFHPRKR